MDRNNDSRRKLVPLGSLGYCINSILLALRGNDRNHQSSSQITDSGMEKSQQQESTLLSAGGKWNIMHCALEKLPFCQRS